MIQPRASKCPQNIQLSYEVPQRIHTAKTYPLQSINGSTIILYGLENGVKIIWRGGRPFRNPQGAPKASSKTNGASKDVIMLDDSDDEAPVEAFVDTPEFEDEEQEHHPSRPYPEIIQVLDLYFGTDVLDIAVLPASLLKAEGASWRGMDGLKKRIVFVVACADNKVRLVNLPLTPPSPTSKARPSFRSDPLSANAGNGSWGETVTELIGHQKSPIGVSITAEFDQAKPAAVPRLIIASHSGEITGLLLLFRVAMSSKAAAVEPFQTISLASPLSSISFNPTLLQPRSNQLLVADSRGVCRIYDFKRLVKSPLEDPSLESSLAEQGTWLLSLYPGFQYSKNEGLPQQTAAHASFGRKTIIDAKWVSGGKAVLALLGDGQWVIWDIEGVGKGSTGGLLGRQGLSGGSRSEFALSGFIEGISKVRVSSVPQITSSKFAPMTPGTRKSTEPFGGKITGGPVLGQISVLDVPSTLPTNPTEESIVFWFGDSYAVIPSLGKYWAANSRKASNGANLFNGTPGGRMIKLEAIDLQGERCVGIDQLVKPHGVKSLSTDILILAEHRFVILEATTQTQIPAFQTSSRLVLAEKKNTNAGDLDVTGIENMLMLMDK